MVTKKAATLTRSQLVSFADASWLDELLSEGTGALRVMAQKLNTVIPYVGSDGTNEVRGTIGDVRFEVSRNE
ncbi:MAG: hypothetical protein Q4A07_06000 [Coriobacteriales bacterium]|nr:hypothetical protein [Coriobacteriales bacterium]